MFRIEKQQRALDDLSDIWAYTYAQWGEEQAEYYISELERGIEYLKNNPEFGKRCDYIQPGFRSLLLNRHVVYYTINSDDLIRIVRILHVNQDPFQNV